MRVDARKMRNPMPATHGWNLHERTARRAGARLRQSGVRRRRTPQPHTGKARSVVKSFGVSPAWARLSPSTSGDNPSTGRLTGRYSMLRHRAGARRSDGAGGTPLARSDRPSGMKFAIPYIRSGLAKRTVVLPRWLSQATVNRRQYKIQCGLNAFEVSKIKGNPQTSENRITL
jgi:hypothetical protein